MKKIDPQTVQQILDAADIVEVVSDFVSLKRRGANYIGLCPFHADRNPSFSVSRSKGVCKCFSCGKGGSPVGFIMEHEQLSYQEALRWLAAKYNIPVEEHELTAEEIQRETERENLLAVNDFAMKWFERQITDSDEGRDVGLAYFRHRGISDVMVKRFNLGFSSGPRDALYTEAVRRGYSERYLLETGLCGKSDKEQKFYDRFYGRVIYPVLTVSGKVVAFGGRTLKTDKQVSKYINSPESDIYSKRRELYGLFQAKKAIVKADRCILVEGYMDVISMHQAGVENVVASSGTALTVEQIRLIRRFTKNVTVVYDSDAAGIKASLRGIDMLLEEGMNVKVLQLPDGDDPDSFSQNHSSTEVEQYFAGHQTDFIRFKTSILLADGNASDPTVRAQVISDIVRSIAVIPDEITRNVYIQECSQMMALPEEVLLRQMSRYLADHLEHRRNERQRSEQAGNLKKEAAQIPAAIPPDRPAVTATTAHETAVLRKAELALATYMVKYGCAHLCDNVDTDGNTSPVTVLQYIDHELEAEAITLANADISMAFERARAIASNDWPQERLRKEEQLKQERNEKYARGVEYIRQNASNVGQISSMEKDLIERIDEEYFMALDEFDSLFVGHKLCSSDQSQIRNLATSLISEKYQMSKIHTKYAKVETERERLVEYVPRAVCELKNAIISLQIKQMSELLSQSAGDFQRQSEIMLKIHELDLTRRELASYLGDRVIVP